MVLCMIYERPADVRVFFYNFPNILTIKGFNMARQIQIRRGTTLENDNFTGAIGEITMDTDAKTLRVHDGETPGGVALAKESEIPDISSADYVIEWQNPTAENNYTWYRKYKSGWVEMGGEIPLNTSTVTMPVQLHDVNYIVFIIYKLTQSNNTITFKAASTHAQTTTNFSVVESSNTLKGWFVSYLSA